MSKTPQSIRGTQDIFGPDAEAFSFVVETFERVRKLYRFRRVEMPVFEKTEVFARSIGETTDIVSKEMYSFEDRGGDSLTLRPEFTAGIARAFLSNGWQQHAPAEAGDARPAVPLRTPAKGALSPVPPDRRRDHRRGRTAGRCGTAGDGRPAAARAGNRRRDPASQHAGRCGQPRGVARGAGRLFPRSEGRAERGIAGAAGSESAAHPRQQKPRGPALRGRCAEDRRVPVRRRRCASSTT